MSHLLARLVERTRGTLPRVEPIIAPRFAPAPINEIATEVEAPAAVRSRATQAALPNETPARPSVRQGIEPPRGEESRREEVAAPRPEQFLVPQQTHPSYSSPSVVRRASPEEIGAPPRPNEASPEQSVAEAAATRPGSAPPATTQPSRILVAGGVDPGHPSAMPGTRRAAGIQPNESQNEPPIVRVTIGRIEVRAETPAPPPRKTPSPPRPTLSLDTYLKERKEGRR